MSNIIRGVNRFLEEGCDRLRKHLKDNSLNVAKDIEELCELFDSLTDEEKDTNEYITWDSSKSLGSWLFWCRIYLPAIYYRIKDKHFSLSEWNGLSIEISNYYWYLFIGDYADKTRNLKVRLLESLHISKFSPVYNLLPNLFGLYDSNFKDISKVVSFFNILYYDVHGLEIKDKYSKEIDKEISENDDEELFNKVKHLGFIKLDGLKEDISYKELVNFLKSIAIDINIHGFNYE